MKNTNLKILTLLPILFLLLVNPVSAKGGNSGPGASGDDQMETRQDRHRGGDDNDENRIRVEIRNDNEIEDEAEVENKVEIAGQNFEIRGEITAMSGNTFMVNGRTITIDPSKVVNFEQDITLQIGRLVKVEGIILDGVLFAREIKPSIIEEDALRIRIEARDDDERVRLETKGVRLADLPALLSPTPIPMTVTPTEKIRIEVRTRGALTDIRMVLEKILIFLKELSK